MRLAKNMFAIAVTNQVLRGNRVTKRKEARVEIRRSVFDRVHHRVEIVLEEHLSARYLAVSSIVREGHLPLTDHGPGRIVRELPRLGSQQVWMARERNVIGNLQALNIRDSVNIVSGVALSKLHLAEYYVNNGDSIKGSIMPKRPQDYSKKLIITVIG